MLPNRLHQLLVICEQVIQHGLLEIEAALVYFLVLLVYLLQLIKQTLHFAFKFGGGKRTVNQFL